MLPEKIRLEPDLPMMDTPSDIINVAPSRNVRDVPEETTTSAVTFIFPAKTVLAVMFPLRLMAVATNEKMRVKKVESINLIIYHKLLLKFN